jgi:hypothetical protein
VVLDSHRPSRSPLPRTAQQLVTNPPPRSSGEAPATVDGNPGPDPRTLDPDRTSGEMTAASDGRLGAVPRTTVVERSTGEEPVTSSMRLGHRPSGEIHAVDVASDPDSVYRVCILLLIDPRRGSTRRQR